MAGLFGNFEREQQKPMPRPSRMPNLGGGWGRHRAAAKISSVIDTASAINIIAILKQELQKVDCVLRDYYARFHIKGVDIEKIKVFAHDPKSLRDRVAELDDGLVDFERRKKITSMALTLVAHDVKQRIWDELRLETQLFDFKDADVGAMSVTIPSKSDGAEAGPDIDTTEFPIEPVAPVDFTAPEEPVSSDVSVYEPSDKEMDLDVIEQAPPQPPEEDVFPAEVKPEEGEGRASEVPELI